MGLMWRVGRKAGARGLLLCRPGKLRTFDLGHRRAGAGDAFLSGINWLTFRDGDQFQDAQWSL